MTMTESPLKNSLLMNLSLLIVSFEFFSVHNSLTFSKTILQCLSNAFTLAIILWLFLKDIIIGVLECNASLIKDIGPCLNSNSSNCFNSSLFNSALGRSINCSLFFKLDIFQIVSKRATYYIRGCLIQNQHTTWCGCVDVVVVLLIPMWDGSLFSV